MNIFYEILNWLKNNYEVVVAFSALFISAYTAYLSRRHNRLSVKPHITGIPHTDSDNHSTEISFEILNGGLGPAKINETIILYNQEIIVKNNHFKFSRFVSDLFDKKHFDNKVPAKVIKSCLLGTSYAISVNERITLLTISFPAIDDDIIKKFQEIIHNFDIIIKYESMYGEKFILDSRDEKSFEDLLSE